MKKNYNKEYKHIPIKNDKDFQEFERICKEINIKKATMVKALIKLFNKNPKAILEQMFD